MSMFLVRVLALAIALLSPCLAVHVAAQEASPPATVRVLITESRTGVPLPGVLVRLQPGDRSAQTDAEGRAILADVAPGTYMLQVSLVGYAYVERTAVVQPGQTLDVAVPLAEGVGTHEERVTVTGGDRFGAREPGAISQQTLGGADLQNLRGTLFDDPMRAVQALPGVASSNDASAIFSVRGQAPQRARIFFDGVPATAALLHAVENPEWGSASLVNSDVLEGVTLLSGASPQRLDSGIGPQLEFQSRNGSADRLRVQGSVSGTAVSGIVEGPLGSGGRGSWLISARQSYIGWLASAFEDEDEDEEDETVSFWFTDALAKLSIGLTPTHRLEGATLGGYFDLDIEEEIVDPNDLWNAENRSSINYLTLQSTFGDGVVMRQRGYAVASLLDGRNADGFTLNRNRFRMVGYRTDLTASLSSAWTLDAGGVVETTRHQVDDLAELDEGSTNLLRDSYDGTANTQAIYGQARWQGEQNVTVNAGGRIDHSNLASETTVSPWAQAEWAATPATILRGGVGLSHEMPTFAHVIGLYAGDNLKPERSWTYDLSVERRLPTDLRSVVTCYRREERDLLWRRDGEPRLVDGVELPGSFASRYENALRGRSYGVELLLQRRTSGRLNGWVSYTYANTEREDVERGEIFPADYAQATFRLSHQSTVGVKYLYGSNYPMRGYYAAGPIDDDEDETPTYLLTDRRNGARLPTYHRLDARWSRAFTYGRSRMTLFVEVTNVLNHANFGPESYGQIEKLFPFFPSAGLLWEF
ncbi:MAG: TonB-dependent receptor [Luteitalea sp.]|nr:TonB-dependent receptor [Luteitalea sp.]